MQQMVANLLYLRRTLSLSMEPADYIDQSDGICDVSISVMDMPPAKPQVWVLGQPLLRKYVSLYDLKRWQLGFGLASHREGVPRQEQNLPEADSFLQSAWNSGFKVTRERKMRLRSSSDE